MEEYRYLGVLAHLSGNTIEIPTDKLETAGIKPNTRVEIFSNNQYVFIRQAENHCATCGGNNGKLVKIGIMNLCADCVDSLSKAATEATTNGDS